MMRTAAWVYRVMYMVLLIVCGTRVLPLEVSWRALAVAVYPISFLALLFLVLLTGITHRPFRWSTWAITATWCFAFSWYAWRSGGSPFVIHELHTLYPGQAAVEIKEYYRVSIPLFVLFVFWFLSFPVVHGLESASNHFTRSRRAATRESL
jgi:hypothetical protein